MSRKKLIWKIPCIILGVVLGIVLLLLIAVTVILVTPRARTAVLQKCVTEINKRTDLDVDLGRLYLSPFHHSPMILYRAYKGEEDLPLHVEIDSLFVGHRGQDTLICLHTLRLQACMKKPENGESKDDFLARTILVDQLLLDQTTFHSDTMIDAVGIDVIVRHLQVKSPELNIAKGQYPLHGLKLADAFVGIELRDTEEENEDTTSTPMAFDVLDGELSNVRFVLNPMGLDIRAGSLSTNVLADVGGNRYDAHRLNIGNASLTLESLYLPFDTIYGDALVDLNTNLITSNRLYARSDEFGAKADLRATTMNLETMRVDLAGNADYRGSKANLKGFYDIDDEVYDMLVNVEQVNASPFLADSHYVALTGEIHAQGKGIDINSSAMKCKLAMNLTDCIYDNINVSGLILDAELANKKVTGNLHLPVKMTDKDLRVKAETEHQFWVSDFLTPEKMSVDYHTQMKRIIAHVAGEDFNIDQLDLDFATDTATSLYMTTEGLTIDAESPMHVLRLVDDIQPLLGLVSDSTFVQSIVTLQDLTVLDTLKQLIPDLRADVLLTKGSPIQSIIERSGLDIEEVALSLKSDSLQSDLALDAAIPDIDHPEDTLHLPAVNASMRVSMTEGKTSISLAANTNITDGVMSVDKLCTDAALQLDLERNGRELHGTGHLEMDSLVYNNMELGNRTADILVSPSQQYENAIRADLRLDDIPMELVSSIIQMEDIDLDGVLRSKATADGLPAQLDLSAEVLPLDVIAYYKPYDVELALGETPIVMEHNNVKLNDVRIYGVEDSYIALNGGMDLNTMLIDVDVAADNFVPMKLEPNGPIPVYGDLATDIRGRVSGPLDTIRANVDVTVLPTTDLTYPIDEKNMAQVKPHGTVNLQYNTVDGELNFGGVLHVDEGTVRYSPKLYPMIPFHVDSGSNVTFNGPLGQTLLNVSASQQVKADVQSAGEETRRVVFNTGVRVDGILDSVGLDAIGFFLEAPEDETITRELASMDEDTREGTAAVLLATGMYMGESNVAAQKSGYALNSIINSRINAAMANSKMGNIVDVDISSGETKHASGKTNDMNIAISKSLFHDRLRITVGSTISDNPEVNKTNGLLSRITADLKLTKSGNVYLRLFSQRDYDNIFEGELVKSGIGVGATKQWRRKQFLPSLGDSIMRTYSLTADADVAYRSNNSIGPNLTLVHSIKNLLGRGETVVIKGYGAYYWSLRHRLPGDPKKSDTYKFGIDASLVFPYLHWVGDSHPDGDTRYRIGYKYENIAGGYGVHKFSAGFSYFIRSSRSRYVTHVFTPFSLSVVKMNVESKELFKNTENFPELVRLLAGNEFVPAVSYGITYSDYRTKRRVNTMIDFEVKEAANLINVVYCAFGHKWSELDKSIGEIPFNEYVRVSVELWNKYNMTDRVCIATRFFAGGNIPLGNSDFAPLSEAFYAGGPNSLRASEPYAYGPGNFHSPKYNQNFFHAGDFKLEANLELRFPIVWKLNGAVFLDAGNVWNWRNTSDVLNSEDYDFFVETMGLTEELWDGFIKNPNLAKQIALGTGAGLRLDIDGLVIRLDLGIGIHAPYQTYKYDKDGNPDLSRPITTYYNMPSVLDGLRLNFSIGYPF